MVSTTKIAVLGSKKGGKSALVKGMADGTFSEDYNATIGVDFKRRIVNEIKLQLCDVGGDELFQALRPPYYRDAKIILLCCDLTSTQSLTYLTNELAQVRLTKSQAVIYLIGTKADLKAERQVTDKELESFVEINQLAGYRITSAKENNGVEDLVNTLATHANSKNNHEKTDLNGYDGYDGYDDYDDAHHTTAKTFVKLSKFYAMFNKGYSSSEGKFYSFSWQQLNPFRGLVESSDYPLSKIRRSTLSERLVDTYRVIAGKRSKITLEYPTTHYKDSGYSESIEQTYQKRFGLLDYLTLGIFPLASTLKSGVWAGFQN